MHKRLTFLVVGWALLAVVFLFIPSPIPRVIFAILTVTLALVVLLSRRNAADRNDKRGSSNELQRTERSPFLLAALFDATIGSMREGMLVVDRDMRVVASNPVAYRLFGPTPRPVTNQRLTELTRSPAIYEVFLDALRGIERSAVKVDTVGPERLVFDLRVTPLPGQNGGGPTGAVGVFVDVTRTERLELVSRSSCQTSRTSCALH